MHLITWLVMPGTRVRPLWRASMSYFLCKTTRWMAGTSSAKTRFALLPGQDGTCDLVVAAHPVADACQPGDQEDSMATTGRNALSKCWSSLSPICSIIMNALACVNGSR